MLHFAPVRPCLVLKIKCARDGTTSFAPRYATSSFHMNANKVPLETNKCQKGKSIRIGDKIAFRPLVLALEGFFGNRIEKTSTVDFERK